MRLEQYDIDRTYQAKILSTERITDENVDEVRDIILEVDHHAFDFKIGQSIGVILRGPHDEIGHPHHFRLYTVAGTPYINQQVKPEIRICVKRCNYIDEYSGERYNGIASNYLCDRKPGDTITICGPFGNPFPLPADKNTHLILIGMGTGIAPFRALVKHIYEDIKDWKGKVYLLHGARTGLELLYMNNRRDDFAQYYDEPTFQAITSLSAHPEWADPMAADYALEDRADEILHMVLEENACVFIAGLKNVAETLDQLFASRVGPDEAWHHVKDNLREQKRWFELTY